ncbi:MAG: hypothetical protein HYZ35_03425, partial [Chloroflexi bacterium]|nr:hypothetical protein [Chloroflexota bacterium]
MSRLKLLRPITVTTLVLLLLVACVAPVAPLVPRPDAGIVDPTPTKLSPPTATRIVTISAPTDVLPTATSKPATPTNPPTETPTPAPTERPSIHVDNYMGHPGWSADIEVVQSGGQDISADVLKLWTDDPSSRPYDLIFLNSSSIETPEYGLLKQVSLQVMKLA